MNRTPDLPRIVYHRVIASASGSKRALAALQPIWNQTHALLRHLYSIGAYADRQEDAASYDDHRAIIAALAARDPGLARECMVDHLTRRRDALIRSVTERGGLG